MWFIPVQLHIPDGFLSPEVAIAGWFLAILVIVLAIRQTREQLGERQIPLMGVLAAFIFAAQAINFPIAAGTSGHLLGGALAAVVMGPWAATLIMTAVVGVQGLLFQDGGLLAMGWNILNMGVFTAFIGYGAYALLRRLTGNGSRSRLVAAFAAAWLSVEAGAISTAFELAASGTAPLRFALPAMAGVHALIGLGEAVITVGAVSLLQAVRYEMLLTGEHAAGRRSAYLIAAGLLVALVLALFSPLAYPKPDGLEFVASQYGFIDLALKPRYELLPDYTIPILADPVLTTILAVGLGTVVVFLVAWIVGRATTIIEASGD